MAFEEFSQLSKRRRVERAEKFKKKIVISVVSSILIVVGIAVGVFAFMRLTEKHDSASPQGKDPKDATVSSAKMLAMICSPTDYKQRCEETLSKVVKAKGGSSATASLKPKEIMNASLSAGLGELDRAVKGINETFKFEKPEDQKSYEVCKEMFEDAADELRASLDQVREPGVKFMDSKIHDLRTWLSAVLSYQEACIDTFPDGNQLKEKMKESLKPTREFVSNSLAIATQLSSFVSKLSEGGATNSRHLLGKGSGGDGGEEQSLAVPEWVGREERTLLTKTTANLTPNVTVAKDGSGQFKTIMDALNAIPEQRVGRYYIYVKQGVYEEYVIVGKKMSNITVYGDGSQKTVVTGNKNAVDGVKTMYTATFAAIGEGFIAIAVGFKNTAGPEKHQAVALRVQSDKSIFLNCRMEGYQDTVYAQTHRQFYRSCVIAGTVDFIFGDAAAIFQNCLIQVRKPMENQQNIITAQGRTEQHESTGIVLHNCRIVPDKGLEADRVKVKTYLGRPWKEFSRTVVMESAIGDLVQPEGWMPMAGEFGLKTLFYAEYDNHGPGADVKGRVSWPGYKKSISKNEAQGFTVTAFLQGAWIKEAGVPVQFGFYKK